MYVLHVFVTGNLSVNVPNGEFLKANYKQNGFYRVNYDQSNWQAITSHLSSSSFANVINIV